MSTTVELPLGDCRRVDRPDRAEKALHVHLVRSHHGQLLDAEGARRRGAPSRSLLLLEPSEIVHDRISRTHRKIA